MTCTYKFNTKDGEVKLVGQPAMKAWLAVNGIDAIVAPKGGKYGANPHLVEGEDGQRAKGSAQMSGSDEHVQKGEAETVQAAVEGKHPREIADWLAENSPRADHKIVAQKVADTIRRMESEGAIFNFRVAHMGDIANAELDHSLAVTNFGIDKDRTIVADISVNGADVHGRVGVGYEPILHELVHAVTAVGLELGMTRQFANTELGEAASDLKRIRELVMYTVTERIAAGTATRFEKHLKMLQNNGLKNIHEITAWSLTNTDMQKLMEGIKTGQQTVWSKFVEAVRKILGLSPRNDTALSDVLRIAEQIMNTNLTIYAHDLKYDPYLSIVEPTMNKTVGRNFTTEMRDAYHSEVRKGVRYSVKGDDRDLMITHNLTAANLMHAHKMGGIAVPSLAVVKNDSAIEGFGEITMIGSKAMADPKGYAGTKVFGADIYSPRYPSVEHDIDSKAKRAFDKQFGGMAEKLGMSLPDTQDIERQGIEAIDRSLPVKAQFLKDNGVEPNIVMVAGSLSDERIKRLEKFGLGPYLNKTSIFDLTEDPEFVKRAAAEVIDSYRSTGDERMARMASKLESDPEAQKNVARDIGYKIISDAKRRTRPEADRYLTQTALEKQISEAGISDKFAQFTADTLAEMSKGERIFKGFSNSGKRTYTPHTLENVVAILKKELRGGENFNYGVGSLRAKFTPQFKTIAQIKKEKGRLVSKDQFEAVKKEIDNELFAVGEAISPSAKTDTIISILEDAPKMGLERAAKQYGFDLSNDAKQKAAEFLTRLSHLPTEYFEAKILRDVDLSEFSGAVIPKSTPQNVRDILAKRGVPVREYESEADRRKVVQDFTRELDAKNYDVLFSIGEKSYSVDNGKAQAEFGPVHTEFRDDAAGAVKQLMADKDGEAIVHRDDVGDISLVYGDGKMGLSHIVNRRGAGFVDRIPDLLRDGTLYSKPGQKDRVFIGTDRDEAVLRFEWDGKAKTWLLSAYEKYPDLKPAGEAVQESRRSQVVDERSNAPLNKESLRAAVTRGALGKVINSMIDAGVVVLHDNTSTLPRNADKGVKGVQAVTIPDGTVHLVAANLSKKNAMAVMLHEAFHQGVEKLLGTEQWGALMGRLGSLYRQGQQSNGKANEFFEKARARVAAAKAKGGVSAKMELEEFAAYAIEEYESAPASIKKWVDDLLGMVKAWVAKRFGKQIGDITPAQLSAFAKWAVMDQAVERRGDIFGDIGTLFSVGELSALDDGMVSGGDQPSVNGLKRNAEAITNFLESKAVRSKPDGGFNIPSTVMSHMLYVTDDQKVFRSIIASIPVDVMDFLARKKLSPENVLRDKAVLENMFAVHRKPSVSLGVDKTVAAALMHTVARHAAEVSSMTGGALESGAAGEAGASNAIFSNQNNSDLNGLGNYKNTTKEKNFLKWFGNSKVVDDSGKPLVMYHATTGDFGEFKENTRGVHFVSPSPEWVGKFLTEESGATAENANVMPVYVSAENPFDYENKKHVSTVAAHASLGSAAISQIKKGSWQRLEDRTLLATIKKLGFDGLYVKEDGVKNLAVFRPEQIKSAIGNNGAFDPANPDIRYSLADDTSTTTAPAAPQELRGIVPVDTKITSILRAGQAKFQDNKNRLKQVQEAIQDQNNIDDLGLADTYRANENRPGRIAARRDDAMKYIFKPLMDRIAKSGYTQEQLEELMHAQHAAERNEQIAKINPEHDPNSVEYTGTQGSGMNDEKAQEIKKQYVDATELHKIADQARDITRKTLDMLLAYGYINKDDHASLSRQYKFYVPLKGDGEYGPQVKQAMGHGERDEHILENIKRDYELALVAGEANMVKQTMARMAMKYPNPELYTVGVPPMGRRVVKEGGYYVTYKDGMVLGRFKSEAEANRQSELWAATQQDSYLNYEVSKATGDKVQSFVKPLQDNEVIAYFNGTPVRIQFNDELLAQQMGRLSSQQMGPAMEFLKKWMRWLSAAYTGYSPTFIFTNFLRDIQTGTISMLGNQGVAIAVKAWGNYPSAAKALYQFATDKNAIDVNSEGAKFLYEYRMNGGKTGASHISDLEAQTKELSRMYDDAYGAVNHARNGKVGKAALIAGRKGVGALAHIIESANQVTENSLRLALFMALRKEGYTPAKAAQAAKNVTVNFDRKGSATGALGAFYLFFNPAVQGTANAVKALAKGNHKGQAWAALSGVAMLGLWAASKGMDDDKDRWLGAQWDDRTKNFRMRAGSHQLNIPLSQEFAPAYAFGVAMGEVLHGESKAKAATHMFASFLDAYFPLQGAFKPESDNRLADVAQAAVPTVFKPIDEAARNRNSFGQQVVPENQNTKDKPDNLKMNRSTKGTVYDKAAQRIASWGEITGAGKYENDITKVSPETLKSLWRTYTGGLGTFITDSVGLAGLGATAASSVDSDDVPILKRFYKEMDVKDIRGRYYDLSREAEAAISEFEQAKKLGDGAEMSNIVSGEKAKLVGLGKMVRSISKAAAVLGDEKVSINASTTLTDAEKRAELKRIEAQEEELYRSGIEAFK